jgi:hypothetical protein
MVHQTHEDEKNSPEFFEIDLLEEPDGSSSVSSLKRFDTPIGGCSRVFSSEGRLMPPFSLPGF